jgi:MYXO-CTERM domain-containing protein/uncharacterized repeat protein (TIGR01451 family)
MRSLLAIALLVPQLAVAQQVRFSDTVPGGISATGNTLGLSKEASANGPGLLGSIGTFISLDPNSVDAAPVGSAPWFAGTTSDWTLNGSSAVLDLPSDAMVLHAELVWGGSFEAGSEDVSGSLNDAITIGFGTATESVTPASQTAQLFDGLAETGFPIRYYIRSADVTSFVQGRGAGRYSVSGVPGTQAQTDNSLNAAGWNLVVAYRSEGGQVRNLSIFVGGSFVDEGASQDYPVSGFCAPPFGPVEGNVVVSALEGDAILGGDILTIAPTANGPFVTLSGTNNPSTNFFSSQINDGDGQLDTRGTFGTRNHNAFTTTNVNGGRQGWDLTTIPISAGEGILTNGQTSAVVRTVTTGDSYLPTLLAFEIDVKSTDLTNSTTTATPSAVELGDTLTVTSTLSNTGEAPAVDVRFRMDVDPAFDLVSFEMDGSAGDFNGATVTVSDLLNGVPAGTLGVDEERIVTLEFTIAEEPNGEEFVLSPTWEHEFVTCEGEGALQETHTPAGANVDFRADDEPDTDEPEPDTDEPDTDVGPSDPDTDVLDTGDGEVPDGNCGCSTTTDTAPTAAFGLGFLLLAGLRRRRSTTD